MHRKNRFKLKSPKNKDRSAPTQPRDNLQNST